MYRSDFFLGLATTSSTSTTTTLSEDIDVPGHEGSTTLSYATTTLSGTTSISVVMPGHDLFFTNCLLIILVLFSFIDLIRRLAIRPR